MFLLQYWIYDDICLDNPQDNTGMAIPPWNSNYLDCAAGPGEYDTEYWQKCQTIGLWLPNDNPGYGGIRGCCQWNTIDCVDGDSDTDTEGDN